MKTSIFCLLVFGIIVLPGCKTPPPAGDPSADMQFLSIEANDASKMVLDYTVAVNGRAYEGAEFSVEGWKAVVNGQEINSGLALTALPGAGEIPVRLEIDIPALIAGGIPARDDFTVDLTVDLFHAGSKGARPETRMQAKETAVFPFIREPVFIISEIAILKADLINTRFKVSIMIENPNHFQVELSSLAYELYGNNLLWAEGSEKNNICIPEKSAFQGNVFLTMNFINMKRDLLNQIIRLDNVNYRFAGHACISTGIEYLPQFKTDFSVSGYSRVIDAAQ